MKCFYGHNFSVPHKANPEDILSTLKCTMSLSVAVKFCLWGLHGAGLGVTVISDLWVQQTGSESIDQNRGLHMTFQNTVLCLHEDFYHMKSVQWLQKVGCLKKRAVNWWSFTSMILLCFRAPFLWKIGAFGGAERGEGRGDAVGEGVDRARGEREGEGETGVDMLPLHGQKMERVGEWWRRKWRIERGADFGRHVTHGYM